MTGSIQKNINIDSDLFQSLLFDFLQNHPDQSIDNTKFESILIAEANVPEFCRNLKSKGFTYHSIWGIFYFYRHDCVGKFDKNNNGLCVGALAHTTQQAVDDLKDSLENLQLTSVQLNVKWITDKGGNYHNIVESYEDTVYSSLYPFLGKDVDQYIDDFVKSSASIIILLGPPGTGKTGFIRYMMSQINKRVHLTYDHEVLSQDWCFADFIASEHAGLFVIEDADNLLKARSSGNILMSKFLNVGDGVIKLKNKKLVFSTNLPSTKDIDEAILRQGRCYGVVEFRPLTMKEANDVCESYGFEPVTENRDYKLTEIFNKGPKIKQRSIGFTG